MVGLVQDLLQDLLQDLAQALVAFVLRGDPIKKITEDVFVYGWHVVGRWAVGGGWWA